MTPSSRIRSAALPAVACAFLVLMASVPQLQAQKKGFQKPDLIPLKKPAIPYRPLTAADLGKNSKGDLSRQIKLPNGKTMTVEQYLASLNRIEKNINAAGLSVRTLSGTTRLAEIRRTAPVKQAPNPVQAKRLTTAQRKQMFAAAELPMAGTQLKSISIGKLSKTAMEARKAKSPPPSTGGLKKPQIATSKTKPSVDVNKTAFGKTLRKTETVSRSFTPNPIVAGFGGYGGRITLSHIQTAKAEPIDSDEASLDAVKATDSEFAMGVTFRAQLKLPTEMEIEVPIIGDIQLGDGFLDIYRLESQYTVKSRSSEAMKARSLVKVLDQVIIDDNKQSLTQDSYSFSQTRTYPLSRMKIGSFDMFSYMLDMMMPIEVFWGLEAGGEIDVDMDRAGIQMNAGPRLSQALTVEFGLLPDLTENIVDVGVGGKFELIACNLGIGGVVGLHFGGGDVILKDEAYIDADIELLKGRLYTFYKFPAFICDNIFSLQGLDPNCYGIRVVEDDIVSTPAALRFTGVLLDDNKTRTLNW